MDTVRRRVVARASKRVRRVVVVEPLVRTRLALRRRAIHKRVPVVLRRPSVPTIRASGVGVVVVVVPARDARQTNRGRRIGQPGSWVGVAARVVRRPPVLS